MAIFLKLRKSFACTYLSSSLITPLTNSFNKYFYSSQFILPAPDASLTTSYSSSNHLIKPNSPQVLILSWVCSSLAPSFWSSYLKLKYTMTALTAGPHCLSSFSTTKPLPNSVASQGPLHHTGSVSLQNLNCTCHLSPILSPLLFYFPSAAPACFFSDVCNGIPVT